MDCSITTNYLKEKLRMSRYDARERFCKTKCENCPLSHYNNGKDSLCEEFEKEYPEEAIAIVQKWSDEHPQKTYQDDFFEKFPNAQKDSDGTPKCCREIAYNKAWSDCYCNCVDRCYECWNEAMPE